MDLLAREEFRPFFLDGLTLSRMHLQDIETALDTERRAYVGLLHLRSPIVSEAQLDRDKEANPAAIYRVGEDGSYQCLNPDQQALALLDSTLERLRLDFLVWLRAYVAAAATNTSLKKQ